MSAATPTSTTPAPTGAARAPRGATTPRSGLAVVGHVASREYSVRVKSKAYLVSTLIMLLAIVGGLVAYSVFGSDGSTEASKVGVVGGSSQLGAVLDQTGQALEKPVTVTPLTDESQARQQVSDGDLDAALVANPDGSYTALSEKNLSDDLAATLTASVRQATLDDALTQRGVDQSAVNEQVARASVTTTALDPPDADEGQRTVIAYIAVLLLFFSVFVYGLYVATGVVEEKSSRVVELLLSTITPLQLLAGKVIGIGAVGLTQLVVLGGAGLVTALATGLLTISATAIGLFASVLVWYVLGFAFFALLYAAAGSLVSRQEDINSVASPLNLIVFAAYFLAQISLSSASNTAATILAWVPPFSAFLMPLRIAQGLASPLQIAVTIAAMLGACAVAALVAARIYRNSVLNTGRKQGWREAFASS